MSDSLTTVEEFEFYTKTTVMTPVVTIEPNMEAFRKECAEYFENNQVDGSDYRMERADVVKHWRGTGQYIEVSLQHYCYDPDDPDDEPELMYIDEDFSDDQAMWDFFKTLSAKYGLGISIPGGYYSK